MTIAEKTSDLVRRLMNVVLPARAAEAVARRLATRSLVTRDPEVLIWFRRVVLRHKPVLFHFEVQLAEHCNRDCKACSTFSTLSAPALADLKEVESDLEDMARIFSRVREIHLIGGEPLLHPQVLDFCRVARKHFPKSRISLKTNGTLLMAQPEQFWNTLSENRITLLLDSYPADVPAVEINAMGKRHHVRVVWTDPRFQFWTIPVDVSGGHDAASSFKGCRGLNNRPLLRHGQLYPCAYVARAEVFRERFGVAGLQVYPTDSIGIRDEPDPEQVFAFLRNPVHWCSNCDMDNKEFHGWEPSTHDIAEWTCRAQSLPGQVRR